MPLKRRMGNWKKLLARWGRSELGHLGTNERGSWRSLMNSGVALWAERVLVPGTNSLVPSEPLQGIGALG